MKNKIFLFILLLSPIIIFGQKTKKITDKEKQEVYFVLKSDQTIKQGNYKKFGYKNALLIDGFYKNGEKDSVWNCYDLKGDLSIKYDFKNKKLLYSPPTQWSKILDRPIDLDTNQSRPALFLYGEGYMFNELFKNLRYPQKEAEEGVSGKVIVCFKIDKEGKTSNYYVKDPISKGLDEEALRVVKLFGDNWLPNIKNGQTTDSEYTMPIRFTLN